MEEDAEERLANERCTLALLCGMARTRERRVS